jgi:hypothetical protein
VHRIPLGPDNPSLLGHRRIMFGGKPTVSL